MSTFDRVSALTAVSATPLAPVASVFDMANGHTPETTEVVTTSLEDNMIDVGEVLLSTKRYEMGKIINFVSNKVVGGDPTEWDLVPMLGTCILLVKAFINIPDEPVAGWMQVHMAGLRLAIGGEGVVPSYCQRTMDRLVEIGLLDGEMLPTRKLAKIMTSKAIYKPSVDLMDLTEYRASNSTYDLRRGTELGDAVKAASIVEKSSFSIRGDVLQILLDIKKGGVYSKGADTRDIMATNLWALEGMEELFDDVGEQPIYQSWKMSSEGRMFPLAWRAPNLQGSEMHKACFGWAPAHCNMDYDPMTVIGLIIKELKDMTKLSDADMRTHVDACCANPKEWLLRQIIGSDGPEDVNGIPAVIEGTVKKPSVFMAWCISLAEVVAHLENPAEVEKPVMRLPFGMDANGSGAQVGGFIAKNEVMLQRTGLTAVGKLMDDAYMHLSKLLAGEGFGSLTRDDCKWMFNATQYGQGWFALSLFSKDMEPIFDKIWPEHAPMSIGKHKSMDVGVFAEKAKAIHKTILRSFGKRTLTLMSNIANAIYNMGTKEVMVSKDVEFLQADGFQVRSKARVAYSVSGKTVDEEKAKDLTYSFFKEEYVLENFSLRSDEINYKGMASKAYVKFIHSTDALVCRTIVRNLEALDVSNVFPVHDCIYVQAADMPKLRQAIDTMYLDLFGTLDETYDASIFPMGIDLLGLYYQGTARAAINGEQPGHTTSQFWTKDPAKPRVRTLQDINGLKVADIVNSGQDKYWS